jgi:shikimate dehydrogenase
VPLWLKIVEEQNMRLFGLIGFPLSHSFSGSYFAEKFKREGIHDARYDLYPVSSISLLPGIITRNPDLLGLNVTIPYKEQVLPFLDQNDSNAAGIGAVNTIKIIQSGNRVILEGYNTDAYGFGESLKPLLKQNHKVGKAIILGTGGASRAVDWVLRNMGFEVVFVSRSPRKTGHISYHEVTEKIIAESKIIVNTSPAGMYPEVSTCPDIPYKYLTAEHILFDLVYNPEETLFLKNGRDKGAIIKNGLQMLYLQAEKSWEIWNSDL